MRPPGSSPLTARSPTFDPVSPRGRRVPWPAGGDTSQLRTSAARPDGHKRARRELGSRLERVSPPSRTRTKRHSPPRPGRRGLGAQEAPPWTGRHDRGWSRAGDPSGRRSRGDRSRRPDSATGNGHERVTIRAGDAEGRGPGDRRARLPPGATLRLADGDSRERPRWSYSRSGPQRGDRSSQDDAHRSPRDRHRTRQAQKKAPSTESRVLRNPGDNLLSRVALSSAKTA